MTISKLQLTLRKALLHKASAEAKSKFTGKGLGTNLILKEDAESIICTIMDVIAAKRSNTKIVLSDGTEFDAKDYNAIGTGLAKVMNWSGVAYFSDIDSERPERAFVSAGMPKYEQDEFVVPAKDNLPEVTIKAEGITLSPKKFEELIKDFNKLQSDDRKITVGEKVAKVEAKLSDFGYVYVQGQLRQISRAESVEYDAKFATLVQPICNVGFAFGTLAEEETDIKVMEWLW